MFFVLFIIIGIQILKYVQCTMYMHAPICQIFSFEFDALYSQFIWLLVMLYASAIWFKYNYMYQFQFRFSYSVFRMPYIRRECLDLAFCVQLCESYSVTSSELNLFTIHHNQTVKSHCTLYIITLPSNRRKWRRKGLKTEIQSFDFWILFIFLWKEKLKIEKNITQFM